MTANQTLRLDPKLKVKAIKKAKSKRRTFNQYVVELIERDLTNPHPNN